MSIIRGMYEEIKADLVSKGLGGIVEQVEKLNHDYKNSACTTPTSVVDTYTPPKTKNESLHTPTKNERATVGQTVAPLPIGVVN